MEPAGIDQLLDELLLERHPYTVSQANGSYETDKAYIKIATLKAAALLALRNVYQVASHTFHVYLWDLLPGARENASHVFTQVATEMKRFEMTHTSTKYLARCSKLTVVLVTVVIYDDILVLLPIQAKVARCIKSCLVVFESYQ